MSEIRIRAVSVCRAEDQPELEELGRRLTENEVGQAGTLGYDRYFGPAPGTMVTHEHYKDSRAAIEHMEAIDWTLLGRVLELTTIEALEVYGDPSPELMAMFGRGGVTPVVYPLFTSLFDARERAAPEQAG